LTCIPVYVFSRRNRFSRGFMRTQVNRAGYHQWATRLGGVFQFHTGPLAALGMRPYSWWCKAIGSTVPEKAVTASAGAAGKKPAE
jgi:hypothetical protein